MLGKVRICFEDKIYKFTERENLFENFILAFFFLEKKTRCNYSSRTYDGFITPEV